MATVRCSVPERKVFAERYAAEREYDKKRRGSRYVGLPVTCPEPALGTLDERLDILIRRLGGKTGPVRMTAQERRDYERFLAEEESA